MRGTYREPTARAEGNVVIAAHRDTHFSSEIVDPEDTQVMESRARPELTLVTCYPFYFVGAAPKRFIAHARPAVAVFYDPRLAAFFPGDFSSPKKSRAG